MTAGTEGAPLQNPWSTLTRLSDAIMWAIGTTEAIDRLDAAWVASFEFRHDPYTARGRRAAATRSYCEVNVVWAANHLVTAYRRLRQPIRERIGSTSTETLKVVERLRDVFEHWEQNRGSAETGARQRLRAADPGASPWTTQWSGDGGVTIAGSLRVPPLRSWAQEVLAVSEIESGALEKILFST